MAFFTFLIGVEYVIVSAASLLPVVFSSGFFFLDLDDKIVSAPLITHRYRDLGTEGLLIERDGPNRNSLYDVCKTRPSYGITPRLERVKAIFVQSEPLKVCLRATQSRAHVQRLIYKIVIMFLSELLPL